MIFVDSNVLIDIIEVDPVWEKWSSAQIEQIGRTQRLAINEIVIAEAAPRSGPLVHFLVSLTTMRIDVESLSADAAYRAGTAFQAYRERQPERGARSVLADFLIGGHAESLGAAVLTRDPRFYRAYFPSVPLIVPAKEEND